MLVRPHDGGIDGMLLVGRWPKTRQGFECGIPHAELAPACEAHKDRIPIAVSLGHVAPRSAGAQNPENTVDRSPLVRDRWTTFAPVGEQWVENAPFRVRQIAPTQCCLLQKGSLESKLDSSVKNRQRALASIGLSEYAQWFADKAIDVSVVRDLRDQDLKDVGVRTTPIAVVA
jgi:hypothetical protein